MKLYYKYFLLILILDLFTSTFTFAQKDADGKKSEFDIAIKKVEKLSVENAEKSKVIDDQNAQIKSLEKKNKLLNKQIASDEKRIAELEKKISQNNVDELMKQVDSLGVTTSLLSEQLIKVNKHTGKLQNDLDKLLKFRELYVQDLLNNEQPYLEQPFSFMTNDHLKEVINLCMKLGKDDDIDKLLSKLKIVLQKRRQYENLCNLLEERYNSTNVKTALSEIEAFKATCNEVQKTEIDEINVNLGKYANGMKFFQSVVENLNKRLETYRESQQNSDLAVDEARVMFEAERTKYYEMEYFTQIPYLSKLYTLYKEDILKDPLQHSSVEDDIFSVVIE